LDRHALHFGQQKINIHLTGHEFEPKAHTALPGTVDLCFITDTPIETVHAELKDRFEILEGGSIVERTGAVGNLRSIYIRDPDLNLIEYAFQATVELLLMFVQDIELCLRAITFHVFDNLICSRTER
jgi:hypothetical protein